MKCLKKMNDVSETFQYAPVLIHTYTRLEHLKKTIGALLDNDLACSTDLFIASDAPKENKDERDVLLVRKYIQSIQGFKSVNIILRDRNFGLYLNAATLAEEIYKKTDRLIAVEEDLIVGKGFLRYINDGLNLYKADKSVFAICGYLDKSVSLNSSSGAVLLPGFNAWGYGIWRERFYEVPNFVDLATEFLQNPAMFIRMNLNRPDLLLGVRAVSNGLTAADLAYLLHMIKTKKRCLFPSYSLVRNIGNDGTGENCVADVAYQSQSYNKDNIVYVGLDKMKHYHPNNPFFSSLGGWGLLIINLIKYFFIVIFGERLYTSISKAKGSIKQMMIK